MDLRSTETESIQGLMNISEDYELVTDADEEIFILYSELLSSRPSDNSQEFRGLGYVDSRKDVLELKFELRDIISQNLSTHHSSVTVNAGRKARKVAQKVDKTIEIELYQDKTALRSRRGDTGSVVWKASVDFAQLILQQYYSGSKSSILNRDNLSNQNVIELGAGTGLLSIALSPLVQHYIATDIGPLIPLIKKNVTINFPGWPSSEKGNNISVEELDWVAINSASASDRKKIFNIEDRPADLLLAVDCIYHPSLIPPFIATVDYLSTPEKTVVLVVSELRAEDVMRDFLNAWLSQSGWQIWRIPNANLGKNYVMWMGRKIERQ